MIILCIGNVVFPAASDITSAAFATPYIKSLPMKPRGLRYWSSPLFIFITSFVFRFMTLSSVVEYWLSTSTHEKYWLSYDVT